MISPSFKITSAEGIPWQYLVVYRGADALWKSFIVERCRDTAQTSGLIINNLVNLFGGHSGMNLLCHQVKHCNVDLAALTNASICSGVFDHIVRWDDMSFLL